MATKDFSNKQEKKIADYLGWKVVAGSGARDFNLGDIVNDSWLGECKTHIEPYQTVVFYSNVWNKIVSEATSNLKHPVLFVDDGSQKIENTWCMFETIAIDWEDVASEVFPYKIKTNVRFEHIDLYRRYKQDKDFEDDKLFVYTLKLNNSNTVLCVCPLSEFFDIVNSYY